MTAQPGGETKESQTPGSPTSSPAKARKRNFYGIANLDPIRAKVDFAQIVDEVIQHFTARPDAKVSISIEIRAESGAGFDDSVQRAVKENCKVLRFKNSEFEDS